MSKRSESRAAVLSILSPRRAAPHRLPEAGYHNTTECLQSRVALIPDVPGDLNGDGRDGRSASRQRKESRP
jgi:hypothetical protein